MTLYTPKAQLLSDQLSKPLTTQRYNPGYWTRRVDENLLENITLQGFIYGAKPKRVQGFVAASLITAVHQAASLQDLTFNKQMLTDVESRLPRIHCEWTRLTLAPWAATGMEGWLLS